MAAVKKQPLKKSHDQKVFGKKSITFTMDQNKVATITFDLPGKKVNLLRDNVMQDLNKQLDLVQQRLPKALIFRSAKQKCFIAGADIMEIMSLKTEEQILEKVEFGQQTLNRIENLPFPTIAIIDGIALGGGLELALACSYRLVSDEPYTHLGLPEVLLGILPGFGGTQRLPRIVSLPTALTLLCSGKKVSARQALKIGLADYCIPSSYIDFKLEKIVKEIVEKKSQKKKRAFSPLGLPLARNILFSQVLHQIEKKTKGHYPAPIEIVNLVKKTFCIGFEEAEYKKGFLLERKAFAKLATTQTAKNLLNLFHNDKLLKKENWGKKIIDSAPHVENTAVIGAGVMGGGISWLLANHEKKVRLFDINQSSIYSAFKQIENYNSQLLHYKKAPAHEIKRRMGNVSFSTVFQPLPHVDLVIEAVSEKLEVKKKVYKTVEDAVSSKTVIASNTSSLPIGQLSEKMKHPQRFIGIHFFNPVNRMPLVEIIPSKKTNELTIGTAVRAIREIGKVVVLVKDSPGFLVNRLLFSYLNEAMKMLEETGNVSAIDNTFLRFGMPMGPLRLLDEVGLDVAVEVAEILHTSFGKRMEVSKTIYEMTEKKKWLGRKTGKGFYSYGQGQPKNNDRLSEVLKVKHKKSLPAEHLLQRPLMLLINESIRCYEEKICSKATEIDLAMVYGTGFPPFHGGPLKYLDTMGLSKAKDIFQDLASRYGSRFNCCDFFKKMENEKKSFYGANSN